MKNGIPLPFEIRKKKRFQKYVKTARAYYGGWCELRVVGEIGRKRELRRRRKKRKERPDRDETPGCARQRRCFTKIFLKCVVCCCTWNFFCIAHVPKYVLDEEAHARWFFECLPVRCDDVWSGSFSFFFGIRARWAFKILLDYGLVDKNLSDIVIIKKKLSIN